MTIDALGQALPPVFSSAFGIGSGDIVSLVGCGGKTSLIHRLALENRKHFVLLTTTTKIFMPPGEVTDHFPQAPTELRRGINLVYGRKEKGKLIGLSPELLAQWISAASITLVEADGSKGLPLKGWAEHEPIVPHYTTVTVGVCAVWPVGRKCGDGLVHRMEHFCHLTGASLGERITLDQIAAMIGAPHGMFSKAIGRKVLLMNQVENRAHAELAHQLAGKLQKYDREQKIACFSGSVHKGTIERIGETNQ